jgi:hypothetical protein
MMTRKKRVAVLAPFGRLDHQPVILNAIKCFVEGGYEVDIFTIRNLHFRQCYFDSNNVNLYYLPVQFHSPRESRVLVTFLFMLWLPFVLHKKYLAVFAGGARSLFAAWFASWFRRLRIINYQMELHIGPKLKMPFPRVFKWIERRAIRRCFLSLEHDEMRASILCSDSGISRDQIELLPNAPCGRGEIQRNNFLHNKFSLKSDVSLLVTAGSLSPEFLSKETVIASQNLPQGWICILHSSRPRLENDPYIMELLNANNQHRAVFSFDPLPYESVFKIFSSANIGLALYGDVGGANTTEVGLASGKLSHFLKFGVPVIVSDFPMLRDFVMKHRVGIPLADLTDLPRAINTILDDYEGYCKRAAETFTRELAFQTNFKRVVDKILA